MERIAVIGAGLIGRAWAIVFARAGHPVRIWDQEREAVRRASGKIRVACQELREFGLIDEAPDVVMARIAPAESLDEAVRDADYVQENTAERLDTKKSVFERMDAAASADCILASSTSTIRTSLFAEDLQGRRRCLVAHPVNPPHVVPIVEITPAPFTDPDIVTRARALQERVGQVPITVKREVEGFILNRMQAALLNEAWRLVKEDYVSVEDLDKTIRDGLGLRWACMGPFETIDLNAPGGVEDYAARYSEMLYGMMQGVTYEPWDDGLVARITAERRAIMPADQHDAREAWRDRRLMALVAHKRALNALDQSRG